MTYNNGQYYAPIQPPPPVRKRHTGLKVFAVLAVVFVAGVGGCTAVAMNAATDAIQNPSNLPTIAGSSDQTKTPTSKPKGKETVPSFLPSDGTLLVGADVKPGTYQATCPVGSVMCYWSRLSATTGDLGAIIANEVVDGGARATLTIKPGDKAVEISFDGAAWKRIK